MLRAHYDIPLVLLSILVAILAAYTALSLAERVTSSQGRASYAWTTGGALAMGSGIWAMHFVGMVAFRLPIPIGYDIPRTLLSLLLAITVSGFAMWQACQPNLHWKRLLSSTVLMGFGINTMHYTGMAAMRMMPDITYDPMLFALSVVIALAASAAGLWIAFILRRHLPHPMLARFGGAVALGGAIVGMHYTGIAAARFPLGSVCTAAYTGVSQDGLALVVVLITLGVLTAALLASGFDARIEAHSKLLAISQATAEERQALLMREREARSQAESMSAMKDEFLATLSHELRTPLSAILGWAEMLRRGVRDEAIVRRGLETIERNARAQARLIDDLLDMSRIVSGKVRLDMQRLEPCSFIDAALETVRPAAIAKNITLTKTVHGEAGALAGDPNRLQQVMWNLLSNAVKFTPAGGAVDVVVQQSERDIQIEVIDTGIGIKPDFLPFVFDRFRQADASTTRQHGGLGLGLAIVKQLIELHGGIIFVASGGDGQGATFTVRLPLAQKPSAPAGDAPPGRPAPQPDEAPGFERVDLAGIKVLVVDDAPDTLELVREVLGESGASTIGAASSEQALRLVMSQSPDVIVSDIGMPHEDGYDLIRRVRKLGPAGQVPAVALTAFTHQEDRRRALEAGFTAYLGKPAEPALLVATVAGVVRQGRDAPVQ